MRPILAIVPGFVVASVLLAAQAGGSRTLDIYVADTEGGKAALFVAPSGETVLIDSGNPGARDGDRIFAMIQHAGVRQIDHLISTHYHIDHIGGMPELARRIPIRHYIDHGPTVEPQEQVANFQQTYAGLYGAATHTVVKPGDSVPVTGLDWRIVSAGGQAVRDALPGGGQANADCAAFVRKNAPKDENNQSVGSVVTFGRFKLVDLGDLMWDNEFDLVCPRNLVGPVDLYMVTHHGIDASGSPALVHAIQPRVAVMQNGPRKGATINTLQTLRSTPGFEDVWQLHWSYAAMIEHNPAGVFIANVDDMATIAGVVTMPAGAPGSGGGAADAHSPAYWIRISASNDGTFSVTNSRNNFSKTYVKR